MGRSIIHSDQHTTSWVCPKPSKQLESVQLIEDAELKTIGTMGVPFEALIPYAIMLGVCASQPSPHSFYELNGCILSTADVRCDRSRSFEDQAHAEWRKEGQTFGGSVGQSRYPSAQIRLHEA